MKTGRRTLQDFARSAADTTDFLTGEEESALWVTCKTGATESVRLKARDELLIRYLPLCHKEARTYARKNVGLDVEDLLQVGTLELLRCIDRFDPSNGARLGRFSRTAVRGAIQEYISSYSAAIRLATTKFERALFNNWGKLNLAAIQNNPDATNYQRCDHIAKIVRRDFGFPRATAAMVMTFQAKLQSRNLSLDVPVARDGDDNTTTYGALLVSDYPESDPQNSLLEKDEEYMQANARASLCILNDRERRVIISRILSEDRLTLHDLAREFGVSAERVRQIEAGALKKLKAYLTRPYIPRERSDPGLTP